MMVSPSLWINEWLVILSVSQLSQWVAGASVYESWVKQGAEDQGVRCSVDYWLLSKWVSAIRYVLSSLCRSLQGVVVMRLFSNWISSFIVARMTNACVGRSITHGWWIRFKTGFEQCPAMRWNLNQGSDREVISNHRMQVNMLWKGFHRDGSILCVHFAMSNWIINHCLIQDIHGRKCETDGRRVFCPVHIEIQLLVIDRTTIMVGTGRCSLNLVMYVCTHAQGQRYVCT